MPTKRELEDRVADLEEKLEEAKCLIDDALGFEENPGEEEDEEADEDD